MDATVQKWGNSLAFRIPSALAKDAGVRQGTVVELSVQEGTIVLKPKARKRQSLKRLLKAVSKSNLHGEQLFGRAGREAL